MVVLSMCEETETERFFPFAVVVGKGGGEERAGGISQSYRVFENRIPPHTHTHSPTSFALSSFLFQTCTHSRLMKARPQVFFSVRIFEAPSHAHP